MANPDLTIENKAYADALRAAIFTVAAEWKGTVYLYGGDSKQGIDCSHFVYQVINGARRVVAAAKGESPPQVVAYRSTSAIESSGLFTSVTIVQPGDLVMWDGHAGIVIDPAAGSFIGAQTSTGVAEANYKSGYWKDRGVKKFLRFIYLN